MSTCSSPAQNMPVEILSSPYTSCRRHTAGSTIGSDTLFS